MIYEGQQIINQGTTDMPTPATNTSGHHIPGITHHADGRPKTREERVKHMIEKGYKAHHTQTLNEMPEEHFTALEAAVHRTGVGASAASSHADTQPTNPAMAHIQATGGGQPLPGHTTPEVPGFNQQTPQRLTMEQYIGQAPPGIREILVNMLSAYNQQKEYLIGTITANAANRFSKEYLERRSLEELTGIAALAGATLQPNQQSVLQNGQRPVANFLLAGGVPPVSNGVQEDVEPLLTPVYNWGQ
jgi:hypothetical protein